MSVKVTSHSGQFDVPLSPEASQRVLAAAIDVAPLETQGTRIGPYKLLERLGEGGFGVVWMAEQREPILRRVALKIIKSGMDTREVVARFEAERQALALMDHPNIARIFDGGATEAGRPYLVMELVRGVAITSYCNQHRLPTEARLRLFAAVCQAVQHAHQKGVIHRDLKPSNILVTLYDGVPVPKVIDFGIAKATSVQLTEKTFHTRFHAFIGTPVYTSPEQIEMSGLDVDTRSDIYSLGVLLYELLAGRPPFDSEALLKSGLEAMRRTIREIDPPRPSNRLRTLADDDRTTIAKQRGTDPAKLSLLLRGDLDWIVMRCLEKDRTRRYETANGLAADVHRYLKSEPIAARAPSQTYRLRKFIRRHKLGFAAAMAVLLSLIAGLATSSVLYVRERTAAAKSAQVAQFMKDMLNGVGPAVARGRDTTMLREILDQTAARLDAELKNQPQVAADLQDTLGQLYRELAQYPKAVALLRQAVATRRRVSGDASAALASSLHHLGDALAWNFQVAEAEPIFREAVAIREKLHGRQHPDVAASRFALAEIIAGLGKLDEAETIAREVLATRKELFGDQHVAVAESLFGLGRIELVRDRNGEALALYRESLAMRRKLLGDEHVVVAGMLDVLGAIYASQGSLPAALEAYRECLATRRKLLGDGHQEVGVTALEYARLLSIDNRGDESIAILREVIAGARRTSGHDLEALAACLLALGAMLEGEGHELAEAAALNDEAHALFADERRKGTPISGHIINAMARFSLPMFFAGRSAGGLAMTEESVRITQAMFGLDNSITLEPMRALAWMYLSTGRTAQAITVFEEVEPHNCAVLGPGHRFTLLAVAGLGQAYREQGRFSDAHRVLEERIHRVESMRENGDEPDAAIAAIRCELGLTLLDEQDFADAERVLRQSLADYDHAGKHTFWQHVRPRARAASGLGLALAAQGKFAEAEPFVVGAFRELEATEKSLAGDRRRILDDARAAIVQAYTVWGKPEQAATWRQPRAGPPSEPAP